LLRSQSAATRIIEKSYRSTTVRVFSYPDVFRVVTFKGGKRLSELQAVSKEVASKFGIGFYENDVLENAINTLKKSNSKPQASAPLSIPHDEDRFEPVFEQPFDDGFVGFEGFDSDPCEQSQWVVDEPAQAQVASIQKKLVSEASGERTEFEGVVCSMKPAIKSNGGQEYVTPVLVVQNSRKQLKDFNGADLPRAFEKSGAQVGDLVRVVRTKGAQSENLAFKPKNFFAITVLQRHAA
jgi:hypothetical protein